MVKNTKLWPLHFLLWCTSSPVFPFLSSSEFPFPTVAPTPAPPRTKHKLVVEGKKLTFRCGKKIASKKGKVQWVALSLSCQYVMSLPGYSDATVCSCWAPSLTCDSCFSWYKDGELLEFSHPNYISLKDDHITIVANAINEGTYTCIVKKKNKILTNYSWRVRVRFWSRTARLLCTLNRTYSHRWSPGDLTH